MPDLLGKLKGDVIMFDLGNNKFESVAGDTIHSFAKELIKQQRKSDNYIVGVFNGI